MEKTKQRGFNNVYIDKRLKIEKTKKAIMLND